MAERSRAVAAAPRALTELAASLRSGILPLADYLAGLERQWHRLEPTIAAFLPEADRFARLRRDAEALLERFPDPARRPLLFGVPVGVKDIFNVDGFDTRAGSDVPPAELAGPEASAVVVLKRVGALVAGKTATTEFAYFAPAATRNPADHARTPGGSSSGSAAAVAAGLCPLALGTQTIGSISRPASYCGVVGFKPTYDRISRHGVIPLAPSVDHVGFFTADLFGARLAASVLCLDWRPVPTPGRPVLGIPEGPYLRRAERAGRERFRAACEHLASGGFKLRGVETMEDFDEIDRRHRRLVAVEAARVHRAWFDRWGSTYHEKTRELIEIGRHVSAQEEAAAAASCQRLRERLTATMDRHSIDLWVSPASPSVAPEGLDSTGDPVMNLPWTHAGLPTLTIPLPIVGGDLPFGLQVTARWQADEALLGWGTVLERAFAA